MKRTRPQSYLEEMRAIGKEDAPTALERLRREYGRGGGDPRALIEALIVALLEDQVPPRWVSNAALDALSRFHNYKVRTLDDAFRIRPAGRFDYMARLHSVGRDAYTMVRRAEDEGRALSDDLYDEVGERLQIGKNTVRKYFEYWRERARRR